jgi:hypothetical protein
MDVERQNRAGRDRRGKKRASFEGIQSSSLVVDDPKLVPIEIRIANDAYGNIDRIISRRILFVPFAIILRVMPINRGVDLGFGGSGEAPAQDQNEPVNDELETAKEWILHGVVD